MRFKAEVLSAGRRSYSRKRWYVEGIEGAKKPETRQRREEKAIEDLKEGAT